MSFSTSGSPIPYHSRAGAERGSVAGNLSGVCRLLWSTFLVVNCWRVQSIRVWTTTMGKLFRLLTSPSPQSRQLQETGGIKW